MYLFYTKINWPHGESYTLCVVFIAVLCVDLYDVFHGGYFVFPRKINKASLILTWMTEIEVSHYTNPRWKAPLSRVLASCTSDLLISIPAGAMEAEMNSFKQLI